jgi:hypothetical protein
VPSSIKESLEEPLGLDERDRVIAEETHTQHSAEKTCCNREMPMPLKLRVGRTERTMCRINLAHSAIVRYQGIPGGPL